MTTLRERLTHPAVIATYGVAIGAGLAGLVATFAPLPEEMSVTIPVWLAQRLSETGNREVIFARPAALWLLPIAALPYLLLVLRRTLVDARGTQIAAQLFTRLLVILAAALALAQPSLESPIRGKSVVVVVDVSDSIDDGQLDQAREIVRQARQRALDDEDEGLEREDRTRVAAITYAGRAKVHAIEEETDVALAIDRHEGDRLASDHAGALRLAAALVDPETEGRIILVTDGNGSLAEREDLQVAAQELDAQGITLHTRAFEPAARGDALVADVHLPAELRVGETFEVAIDLVSSAPATTKVRLLRNGEPNPLEPVQDVELRGGRQQVKMQARVTEPGPVVFTATLDADALPAGQNRRDGNDSAAVVGDVRGRPRVLLAGSGGDSSLANALRADHLHVDVVNGTGIPTDLEGMRQYDLVMFSDIPARAVGSASRDALDLYVREHGGGFIMVGGEHSFGLGGWRRSKVEGLLPVRFEGERQREQPKLALVLVIDKSGSMSSEDKLDLVKEASRATARTLDPTDELGVIAFDSRPHVLVRLQPASNRIRIAADIRRLTSGGGTNALPALRESYLQLAGSNALVKHVILLSDGQSPETGINALLGDMRDAEITVSSVGVGAGAGKDLLRRIANRGRGRFYYSHDGTDVPRIFSRETREVTRNAAVERALFPRVAKNAQVLRGIDFPGAPGLRGIVPVKPKPLAETLLRTHLSEPLFVRGRRGLGRTAAFASDAKARWAAAWLGWSGFAKLWSQIARDTMRQGASLLGGARINILPGSDEGSWRVVVDVDAPSGFANDLVGEIEVLDPAVAEGEDGHITTTPLRLSAPGRYEANLIGIKAGQRLVKAKLYDEAQTPRRLAAEGVGQVSIPYPAELMPDVLDVRRDALAALTIGTSDGPVAPILETPGDAAGRTRSKALWPHVLWALMLPLLLLDLLLRRITVGLRRVAA